ncbi:CYTH domain-containing protein [Bacillus toyonensis]|uniref:CYTH domain-containing protein n=1 Tax=Bacillus toyonensis TaxID=155322 RepID=UPI003D262C50
MSKTLENELKLLIDKETYTYILNHSQNIKKPLKQINYYFDTENRCLEKQDSTLRIRHENNRWLLCLKLKNIEQSRYTVSSIEIEQEITEQIFKQCRHLPSKISCWLPPDAQRLLGNLINKLQFLGFIENTRYSINFLDNYAFDLDHTTFPGGLESFELEVEGIESQDESLDILNSLTNKGINFHLNKKSKYKRFLEILS